MTARAGDDIPTNASGWVDEVRIWWRKEARDLPWRSLRDPWPILVCEAMSQQTQLGRVIPAWTRFLERFPDVESAASARSGEVVELWDGLGYNRRAVLLHRCACQVVEKHGGRIPDDLDQLLELPGVGPYTARAVLAFAFEAHVGVLDTNVGRVLARRAGRPLTVRDAQCRADALVPDGAAWEWNQALLDFGASICTKRSPACSECVVADSCGWRGQGCDPASGSAAVAAVQPRFDGSDRQGRGRLVAALRIEPVPTEDLAAVMGWPDDPGRARRCAERVVGDGLAVRTGVGYVLP
ncbi:MAG: A/G-specific adenine glycosylase [Acidimicrobiales bacterium]